MSAQQGGQSAGERRPLQRYKIQFVAASGREEQVLALCDPETIIVKFRDEIARRLGRAGLTVDSSRLQLRLDSKTGPLLDDEDLISNVLPQPATEMVFALEQAAAPARQDNGTPSAPGPSAPAAHAAAPGAHRAQQSERDLMNGGDFPIRVRVLTPHLARHRKDVKDVPLLPTTFSQKTTLGQLRERISQHLCLPNTTEAHNGGAHRSHRECNCSLARAIHAGTLFKAAEDVAGHNRVLVIHSKSVIEPIECASLEQAVVLRAVETRYGVHPGLDLTTKQVKFFAPPQADQNEPVLPAIVAICSIKRHQRYEPAASGDDPEVGNDDNEGEEDNNDADVDEMEVTPSTPSSFLDLHTAESPINTSRLDLTLEDLGLSDLVIEGVLTVYAVCRPASSAPARSGRGKDAIYLDARHWELPVKQTERGMAMFLSSLRMAVHLISRGEKAATHHDSALHILHVLTRFPPAVRAMHILLEGSVPEAEECAALIQACHEVIADMVSTSVIAGDRSRALEGSRLFFGTALCKTKEFALSADDGSMLPYVNSMKVVNLANSETMEPICFPVDTSVGLMERGCFDALKAGIIRFSDDELNHSLAETTLDGRTKRAALLGGGVFSSNTMFDMEILYSSGRYQDNFEEAKIMRLRELKNILQHATNATMAKLQVVSPASLGTAPNPVLTLDRDGFLAVYLGRKPCGQPGRDFMIFRPTRGGECDIDISIVAQLLEPILATRIADGTAIFDGEFHAVQRRSDKPDEILMICVDCSLSMSESAGFEEAGEEEEEPGPSDEEKLLDDIRRDDIYLGTLNDEKEALQAHESFDDMVQTVGGCPSSSQRFVATNFIRRIVDSKVDELQKATKVLEGLQRFVWRDGSGRRQAMEETVKTLRGQIAGLLRHESGLAEFLIYRGCGVNRPGLPSTWKWNGGDAIPALQADGAARLGFASTPMALVVPPDLRCPMTQELFQEPVSTKDGHTYEDAAIRRWFRVAQTSPLTGLRLTSTRLTTNRAMLLRVRNWIDGADVGVSTESVSRRPFTRRSISAPTVTLEFLTPLDPFTRVVPLTTPLSKVYELVFRALRGQYPDFNLFHDENAIDPSDEPLSTLSPSDGFCITVRVSDSASSARSDGGAAGASSDLCLVKVYRHTNAPAFSYWVRKDTKATVETVLFKTWRHMTETSQASGWKEAAVWNSLNYTGDGHMSGTQSSAREKLASLLNARCCKGILGPEPLCDKTNGSGGNSNANNANPRPAAGSSGPDPLVLKLYVCRANSKKKDAQHRTSRLSLMKQMFDQFVNRILAYNYSTHLGLIKFDSTAAVAQRLSPVVENFRVTVQELRESGDTALWDALALARDQIQEYSAAYPGAKKRILCISDGVDTASKTNAPHDLWRLLAVDDITVDSFCLGTDDNRDLRAVSHLTNGFKFRPTSLEQAMAICEMEPVLSQLERDAAAIAASRQPRRAAPAWRATGQDRFYDARAEAEPEVVTHDVFPKRVEHPSLRDAFVELRAISRRKFAETTTSTAMETETATATAASASSHMRTYRIMNEMQQIVARPHPHVDVYVSERDVSFWKVIVQGPPDSIYTGGTFVVYIHMDETYPSFAPKARFVTPIYHPNVNRHGRICHSILDRNWTTDTTNAMVISTVYGLLMEPDYSDPVNIVVTLDFHHDQVAFAEMARTFIRKHAAKTRAEWRAEILEAQPEGADAADEADDGDIE